MLPINRPNSSERGYNAAHRTLRKHYAFRVERGEVICWRCNKWIPPNSKWHLGHDDNDRSKYRGPEHEDCNVKAAAKKGARIRNRRQSRKW